MISRRSAFAAGIAICAQIVLFSAAHATCTLSGRCSVVLAQNIVPPELPSIPDAPTPNINDWSAILLFPPVTDEGYNPYGNVVPTMPDVPPPSFPIDNATPAIPGASSPGTLKSEVRLYQCFVSSFFWCPIITSESAGSGSVCWCKDIQGNPLGGRIR